MEHQNKINPESDPQWFEQDHSMVEHLREQLQLAQMQIAQLQHKVNTSLVLWL